MLFLTPNQQCQSTEGIDYGLLVIYFCKSVIKMFQCITPVCRDSDLSRHSSRYFAVVSVSHETDVTRATFSRNLAAQLVFRDKVARVTSV